MYVDPHLTAACFADSERTLTSRYLSASQVDEEGKIVGQRIYLPNIVFRLIPNATHFIRPKQDRKANLHANQRNKPLAMEQYNPFIATFRVPAALNKIDIKGYLKAVYNLDTTFVHTAIQHKTRYQVGGRGEWKNGKSKDNYKRAVVGLTKPFYYPNDPLGMAPEARTAYEERLNTEFSTNDYRDAEVAMRRRQYANVRNNLGRSERSAKIYATTPEGSLKCVWRRSLAPSDLDRAADLPLCRPFAGVRSRRGSQRRTACARSWPPPSWPSARLRARRPRRHCPRARLSFRRMRTGAAGARSDATLSSDEGRWEEGAGLGCRAVQQPGESDAPQRSLEHFLTSEKAANS